MSGFRRGGSLYERASTPPEFPPHGVGLVNIRLNLLATSLVHDLAPSDVSDVGLAASRRRQLAFDVVDSFADDHLDVTRPLVKNDDVDRLTAFGYAYLDLFSVHSLSAFNLRYGPVPQGDGGRWSMIMRSTVARTLDSNERRALFSRR